LPLALNGPARCTHSQELDTLRAQLASALSDAARAKATAEQVRAASWDAC